MTRCLGKEANANITKTKLHPWTKRDKGRRKNAKLMQKENVPENVSSSQTQCIWITVKSIMWKLPVSCKTYSEYVWTRSCWHT